MPSSITCSVVIKVLILQTAVIAQEHSDIPKKNFDYGVYNYDTWISVTVSNNTEQILDFEEEDVTNQIYPTRVHVATNDSVPLELPLFISATQQKGISSWELPMAVQAGGGAAMLFPDMARTLCPHDAGPDIKTEKSPTIHITTQNPANTTVDIKLKRVTDFYIQLDKEVTLTASPSTPKYYYFSFEQNPWNITTHLDKGLPIFNYTIPKSVILIVESEDELCATVSIQNNTCPVFDDEKEILYQGYHLTMSSKGGITLTQTMFPLGFYVVLVVKESDAECTGASETANRLAADPLRLKSFKFSIIGTVSYREYAVGALVLAVLAALVVSFVALVAAPFRDLHIEEELIINDPAPSTSSAAAGAGDEAPILAHDGAEDADVEAEWREGPLTVARLTRAAPDTRRRREQRYMWGVLTIAVVYALPVVQLLFTYQQMVFATGNQDLCYYNFLCAHPLGALSDFNHVYSNVAYVLLGGCFMLQVRARQRREPTRRQDVGVPQHYGLLYSMGIALCMEGFLSACYHLCPNKMNFQFDSSFMYVIAVLVVLKLYQSRHSDLLPAAHATFLLVALVIAIGMVGILFPSVAFSAFFMVLHLGTCLVFTLQIYYAGQFQLGLKLDAKLQWGEHIKELAGKLSSAAYAVRKIRDLTDVATAKTVYFSYFHSIMAYGILLWGNAADALKSIFVLQKRAIRYIYKLKPRESLRELFKTINILTMPSLYIYHNIMYARKHCNSFTRKCDTHNYNTRDKLKYIVPRTRLSKIQKSFRYNCIQFYNMLPDCLTSLNDKAFKLAVKKVLTKKAYYKIQDFLEDKKTWKHLTLENLNEL